MGIKADRAEATRTQLLDNAHTLFAQRGYAAVGTEQIVARAGVTRGALYHHFPAGKAELFEAVIEEVSAELAQRIATEALAKEDPWDQFRTGCAIFLDACLDPELQQLLLLDAPSVLGWQRWREIDARHGLGLIEFGLQSAMDSGRIDAAPVKPLAHAILGALDEGAMFVARSDDVERARAEVLQTLERLFAGLLAPTR
jgi:AcrR family transcriptional regulator